MADPTPRKHSHFSPGYRAWFTKALAGARAGGQREFEYVFHDVDRVLGRKAAEGAFGPCTGGLTDSDLIQDAMLKGFQHFSEFRRETPEAAFAWFAEIAFNVRLAHNRRQLHAANSKVSVEVPLDESLTEEASDQASSVLDAVLRQEEAQTFCVLLQDLPDRYRLTLLWRLEEGASFKEIGQRLGCTAEAARHICRRAVTKLREHR